MVVIDPHVAGHGVIDAQTEAITAGAVVTDDLGPGEVAGGVLLAAVHGKALLVDLAVDSLIGDDSDVQVAVVLDDVPDAAAIQAVGGHDCGQAVEVVLVSDNAPLVQAGAGIGAGDNDAAGSAVSVIVVGSQAHQDLAFVNQQAVDTAGNTAGLVDVVVDDIGFVGSGVNFHQGSGGVAHAGEIQLAVEFESHTVTGQVVLGGQIGRVAGEDVGVLAPDITLAEDNLGFAGDLVDSDDDGAPVVHAGLVEGVHAEHDFHDIGGNPVAVDFAAQDTLVLEILDGSGQVVVEDVEGGVVAGADVDIVTGLGHGPGIAVAPVLIRAGQDCVDLAGTQSGMGDLFDGVAAVGVDALLEGRVADIAVLITGDSVIGGSADDAGEHQAHNHKQSSKSLGGHSVLLTFFQI